MKKTQSEISVTCRRAAILTLCAAAAAILGFLGLNIVYDDIPLFLSIAILAIGIAAGIIALGMWIHCAALAIRRKRGSGTDGFLFSSGPCPAIAAITLLIMAYVVYISILDLRSTGMFAGLGGTLALMFVVPFLGVILLIDGIVWFVLHKKKLSSAAAKSADEGETRFREDKEDTRTDENPQRADENDSVRCAVRDDWEITPMPEKTAVFTIRRHFTDQEITNLKHGHIPSDMDDRWFSYFENGKLYIHRSWSGICIYIVRFDFSSDVHQVTVNRDEREYACTDIEEDRDQLNTLISIVL